MEHPVRATLGGRPCPVRKAASCEATMRVRSTTRARQLLVPGGKSDEALVRMAGATMALGTAKGLLPIGEYCTLSLSWADERREFARDKRVFRKYRARAD